MAAAQLPDVEGKMAFQCENRHPVFFEDASAKSETVVITRDDVGVLDPATLSVTEAADPDAADEQADAEKAEDAEDTKAIRKRTKKG
jgi:hypothetical protein